MKRSKLLLGLPRKKAFRVFMATVAGIVTLVFLSVVTVVAAVTSDLPNVHKLDQYDPATTTKIYARDGTLVATLFDQNRTPVPLDQVSSYMQQAMVAIEDRRFFEHDGVDWRGVLRAAVGNVSSGDVEQGASTLTMQLARRLFLDDERSYSRKLREAVLAYRIDNALSKEKILELYLNEVYYGAGAYGVDAAASLYFKANPSELNLWQSALLAGLVQAPSATSPLDHKEAALTRMDEVLQAMEEDGKITAAQRTKAKAEAAAYDFQNHGLEPANGMLKYPYFTTYAIKKLSEHFPENYIRRGGLQVYTSLDIDLQNSAQEILTREVTGAGYQMGADSGAVVVLDNVTGQILAMVGGTEWSEENQFNRAWQARRQPGSAFKTFVYAAGLEAGFSPEQELADTAATFNPESAYAWKPSNSDGNFMGPIPLRTGLQFSRNLVAAKLTAHVGPDRVAALARRMGIDQELPEVISLSLGAGEITPLEMARAYSVLPNGGLLKPNQVFLKVLDPHGEIIEDFSEETGGERVVSNHTAAQMCEMLRRVVTGGTGTAASVPEAFIAGKTGTTDDFVDAWFVGFSPHHTISVWIGRDDNKPMGRVYGGTIPADVFRQVAETALASLDKSAPLPGVAFAEPVSVELCWDSTYVALPSCPKTYHDTFSTGVVPSRDCPLHRRLEHKVVVFKGDDGVLTNLPEPLLTPSSPTPAPVLGAALNPRHDPEVVTPAGAMVPYTEKPPKGAVKVVRVKVEKELPTSDLEKEMKEKLERLDSEEEPLTGVETEGEDGADEDTESEILPDLFPEPAVESPPPIGEAVSPPGYVPVPREEALPPSPAGASAAGEIRRVEVERPFPPAQPVDLSEVEEQPRAPSTEVIYTNRDLNIPADPVEPE